MSFLTAESVRLFCLSISRYRFEEFCMFLYIFFSVMWSVLILRSAALAHSFVRWPVMNRQYFYTQKQQNILTFCTSLETYMHIWLMSWGCEGHRASTHIRAISLVPEEKTWTLPALGEGDRPSQSSQDRELEGNKSGKEAAQGRRDFCFLVFTFWLVLNLFWLPVITSSDLQLDLFGGERMLTFLLGDHIHLKWK